MDITLNPVNAAITDISVLSCSVVSSAKTTGPQHTASVNLNCDKPIVDSINGMLSVATTTSLRVDAAAPDAEEPFVTCSVSIGCTVVCPEGLGGNERDGLAKKLREYAVSASIGYAREVVRDECIRSYAKTDLIIPPMDVETVLLALDSEGE
ncbi:MAG: hypothetical protein J6C91_05585 [Muribaculaceae bacterium]|nr:hypothetical protein [Muribaculaceae bacterium]